jgi:ferredoxin
MNREFRPYQIDPAIYKRFDQRNICFERRKWDKDFIAYGRWIYDDSLKRIQQGKEGYEKEHFAALTASWYVHDTFHGTKHSQKDSPKRDVLSAPVGNPTQSTPEQNSVMLKEFANEMGANIVGTTRLNQNWVYSVSSSGKPIDIEDIPNAVVFAVPMDQEMLKKSPTFIASTAVGVAYSKCRFISESLAEFVEHLGYRALPAVNEIALSVPLAIDAGLGEFARNGLLITDKYIGKVLTDMPLAQDSPVDLGVRRFCTKCKKCADSCPVNAISFADEPDGKTFSKSNNPGIHKWYVKADKCFKFWTSNGSDCSNCLISCPFTKPDTLSHNLARSTVRRTGAFNRLLVKIDDWLYD